MASVIVFSNLTKLTIYLFIFLPKYKFSITNRKNAKLQLLLFSFVTEKDEKTTNKMILSSQQCAKHQFAG